MTASNTVANTPFKLISAPFSPRFLFPLAGIVEPEFSVQFGNTSGSQPAASHSLNAGLCLTLAVTKQPRPFYSMFFCSHTCSRGSKPGLQNQRGTIQTVHWNLTQKSWEMLQKIPAQHMPQGNCLQENMAGVTTRNSHGFYPVKNFGVKTLNIKKSHLEHQGVRVLWETPHPAHPCPKRGFRLGWQWGFMETLIYSKLRKIIWQ